MVPIAIVALCGGCLANTMVTKLPGDGHRREHPLTFYLAGLSGNERVDLQTICEHGVSRIQDITTFGDGFLTVITLGIYSPRTAFIECALPTAESAPEHSPKSGWDGIEAVTPRVNTEAPPKPQAETGTEEETQITAEPKTKPEAQPETKTDPESETKPETKTKTEAETAPDPETKPEPDPKAKTEPEADSETDTMPSPPPKDATKKLEETKGPQEDGESEASDE
jgi:hypothetical protein